MNQYPKWIYMEMEAVAKEQAGGKEPALAKITRRFENLSKTTQQMYKREIEKLGDNIDVHNVEQIRKISESFSKNRKMTLYKAMCYYDEKNGDYYREKIKELVDDMVSYTKSENTLSKDEAILLEYFEKVMNVSNEKRQKYIDIWEKLDNNSISKSLIMLHLFHPLRSDYYTLKYVERTQDIGKMSDNDNYYNMETGKIIFNTTVKVDRKIIIELLDAERLVLNNYIQTQLITNTVDKNKLDTASVFKWTSSNSYAKALSRISTNVFGEKMTINSYRHLNDFPEGVKEIVKRLNDTATRMNHTLLTHTLKY
jgi:hypothetical protein